MTVIVTTDMGGTGANTAAGALTNLGAAPTAAYAQANTARDQANTAYGQSNTAYAQANAAYTAANTGGGFSPFLLAGM